MLAAVVVIFVLCWTPVVLFEFWEAINKIFTQVAGSSNVINATRMWLQLLSHVNKDTTLHVFKVRNRKQKCDRISVKVISTCTDTNNCTDVQ